LAQDRLTPACQQRIASFAGKLALMKQEEAVIDTFTKIVLTVMTIALMGILLEHVTPRAEAQTSSCGTMLDPCTSPEGLAA